MMNTTPTNTPTDFFEVVKSRRAVKQYDASYKMSEAELKELLEIAGRAPSSWNLQHWKFFVITDQDAKQRLLPIAYGQQQVVDASAVIAVLGDLEANRNAEAVFGPAVAAGQMSAEVKKNLIAQIDGAYTIPTVPRDEAIRNASLAAMTLMLAARAKGLDTCPMGGFDAQKFVEEFRVPSRYLPVMLITVGKAAQPGRPSDRFPVEETVVWNRF
jgi:nitroreductase